MRSIARTVVVPAAVAIAVVALSACSSGGSTTAVSTGSGGAASAAAASPPASSASSASSAAGSTAGSTKGSTAKAPWAEVKLTRTSADGSRAVSVKVTVTGQVFGNLDAEGKPLTSAVSQGHGNRIAWGDGFLDGGDPGDIQCATAPPLVPLRVDETLDHAFTKPGTYRFSLTQDGCGLTEPVTRSLTITVR